MARDGPVFGLGGALADHHLRADVPARAVSGASARDPQRPAGPQARDQLALERASALHVERLVDRLVRDPHRRIIGELELEPLGDLLRAPRAHPPPVLSARLVAALPRPRDRPCRGRAVRQAHLAREALLHVLTQPRVGSELGRLGPPRDQLGLPLRHRRPVLELVAPRRGVAPQLPRDRRRRAPQPPRGLAHPDPLRLQDRDLLALRKRQVPAAERGAIDRRHPTTFPEPPAASRPRRPDRHPRPHRWSAPSRSHAKTPAAPRGATTAAPATSSPTAP